MKIEKQLHISRPFSPHTLICEKKVQKIYQQQERSSRISQVSNMAIINMFYGYESRKKGKRVKEQAGD
jgi:hypothetical protein